MNRNQPQRLLLALAVLALGSCGDSDVEAVQAASPPAGGTAPAAEAAPAADAPASADRFEVTLGGPPFEGAHRVAGEMGCMVYGGTWQATYEDPEADGLSGMLLQVKEVPATGGSSDKVTLSVVFGEMGGEGTGAVIDVHGAEFGRDGRGTVERDGGGAVIRIEGTAQHGARVEAVLRCAAVEVMD